MKTTALIYLSIILSFSLLSECKNAPQQKNESRSNINEDQSIAALNKHCSDPINSFCKGSSQKTDDNHISLLLCMDKNLVSLDADCQVAFFNYRFGLYSDQAVLGSLGKHCKSELDSFCANKKGAKMVECMFTIDPGKVNFGDNCQSYAGQLGLVLFSDYKVLSDIQGACDSDMDKHGCKVGLGRLGMFGSPVDRIVQCLMRNAKSLSKTCKKKFHPGDKDSKGDDSDSMDAGVHEECRFDLKSLCAASDLSSEEKSYKCLLSHLSRVSSPSCQEAVLEREGYGFRTLGVDPAFYQHCSGDLEQRGCSSSGRDEGEGEGEFTRLTRILLCLQNKGGKELSDTCASETDTLRERFMGNHELNLAFARACEVDREEYCTGAENLVECLEKELQETRDEDSEKCSKQLKLLSGGRAGHGLHIPDDKDDSPQHKEGPLSANLKVKEEPVNPQDRERATPANLQQQYQKVLADAKLANQEENQFCHRELDEFCSAASRHDHKSTISCLREHLAEDTMSPECHEHVGRIQFFLGRPSSSLGSLLQKCDTELSQLCMLDTSTKDESSRASALACLFSHLMGDEKVDADEVNQFLHTASSDTGMDKELFSYCLPEMGELCSSPGGHQPDLECLRENQERIDPESHCFQLLEQFNGVEEKMPSQNANVFMRCQIAIKTFCNNKSPHELVDCLNRASSYPSFDNDCRHALENAKEIVTDAEWKYDTHLNVNCKKDLVASCQNSKTNSEAVECLTDLYKADTLSVKCKTYLEDVIGMDLQEKQPIENEVHHENVLVENAVDTNHQESQLRRGCNKEIDQLCINSNPDQYLECLIDFKMDLSVSKECQEAIISSEIDFVVSKHMEAGVIHGCAVEIRDYCPSKSSSEQLVCLQQVAKTGRLGAECVKEMETMEKNIRELQLDKSLAIKCHSEAFNLCHQNAPSSHGLVNCLSDHMRKLEAGKENKQCISEVVVLIGQAQLDIHKDPDLAEKCKSELRQHCDQVRTGHPGHGDRIKCLFKLQEDDSKRMSTSCRKALNDRVELWSDLSKKYPNIQRGMEVILDSSILILKKKVYPNIGRIFQVLFLFAVAVGCIVLCVVCRAAKRVRRKIL